ncbi:MAG: thioredoxin [Candidatus Lumbricidophila eiseniae]|uniref:Thioredoxin n=1 Tax=Candidatus Lumbricidiphila eiseniae TaxID=1969409 RepID=A0A2A6FS35_9MICO|nr:MAG: thioredoxin [Candidatus Lumbricidophila eiseniae]
MSNARDVTAETFDTEVLQSSKPVVVDFWADWCRPCLAFAPILDQLASDHSDKINLVKVDTEAEPQLAAKYGIMALPTLKVFVNGEVVNSLSGLRSKAALETELAGILS